MCSFKEPHAWSGSQCLLGSALCSAPGEQRHVPAEEEFAVLFLRCRPELQSMVRHGRQCRAPRLLLGVM